MSSNNNTNNTNNSDIDRELNFRNGIIGEGKVGLFSEVNYGILDYQIFSSDRNFPRMEGSGIQDNDVASVLVGEGAYIELYENPNYTGQVVRVSGPAGIPDLGNLRDQISSFRVRITNRGPLVTMYQGKDFDKRSLYVSVQELGNIGDVNIIGFNSFEPMSSIFVKERINAVLYSRGDLSGEGQVIFGPFQNNLFKNIGSLKVESSIRQGSNDIISGNVRQTRKIRPTTLRPGETSCPNGNWYISENAQQNRCSEIDSMICPIIGGKRGIATWATQLNTNLVKCSYNLSDFKTAEDLEIFENPEIYRDPETGNNYLPWANSQETQFQFNQIVMPSICSSRTTSCPDFSQNLDSFNQCSNFVATNKIGETCRRWVDRLSNDVLNPSIINPADNAMKKYCNNNNTPDCDCISTETIPIYGKLNNEFTKQNLNLNKGCWWKPCTKPSEYLVPSLYRNQSCPTDLCSSLTSIINSNNDFSINDINDINKFTVCNVPNIFSNNRNNNQNNNRNNNLNNNSNYYNLNSRNNLSFTIPFIFGLVILILILSGILIYLMTK